MPTPQWVKDRSKKARQRQCVICGAEFYVKDVSRIGKTCSKACRSELMRRSARGRRASPETKAKMSAAMIKTSRAKLTQL